MYPGGNAVNVAVHARRNGATSAYLGAVGTDRAGQVVLAALRGGGRRHDAHPSGGRPQRVRRRAGRRRQPGLRRGGRRDLPVHARLRTTWRPPQRSTSCTRASAPCWRSSCQDLADAVSVLSFDFSERPWDYVQTHAPDVSRRHLVHARRGPRRRPRPGRACLRPLGPSRRGHHAGRRRCGAAARRRVRLQPGRPGHDRGHPRGRRRLHRPAPGRPRVRRAAGPARPQRDPATPRRAAPSYGAFGHRTPLTRPRRPSSIPSATADWTSDEPCNTHEHLSGVRPCATLTFAACGAPSTAGTGTSAKPADLTTPTRRRAAPSPS